MAATRIQETEWFSDAPFLYNLLRVIARIAIRPLVNIEIIDSHHLPRYGPVIVITNHLHWLDTVVALVVMPRWGIVLAADKWAKVPIWSSILRISKCVIFVNRGMFDRKALQQAKATLDAGLVLGIAPEGIHSKNRSLQRGHNGAAYIASRTGVQLVPLVIYGQETVFATLLSFRRPHVRAVFGTAFALPNSSKLARGRQLTTYTDMIMQKLADLLPREYQGVYTHNDSGNNDL